MTSGDDTKQQSFPVVVYRRTLARGWEMFKSSKNEECTATAKEKHIELRALKLHWLLDVHARYWSNNGKQKPNQEVQQCKVIK